MQRRNEIVRRAPRAPAAATLRHRHVEEQTGVPWLATLRIVEALAADPVYLRSLSLDPKERVIRLEGEAGSYGDVLAFVRALDAEPMLRPALLSSHDTAGDGVPGPVSVRFQAVAKWNHP